MDNNNEKVISLSRLKDFKECIDNQKGSPDGIATLNKSGKIPNEQLPEIVGKSTAGQSFTYDDPSTGTSVTKEAKKGAEIFNTYPASRTHLAIGSYSTARGLNNMAIGDYSFASGWSCKVGSTGIAAIAMGYLAKANGRESIAMGDTVTAQGDYNVALGSYNETNGENSVAIGSNLTSNAYNIVMGRRNKTPEAGDSTSASGDLFILGNGFVSTNNAFRITHNGTVMATKEYTAQGADYAEMFEWLDGNPDNEDRVGVFVTLEGKKIRIANSDDEYILGVVSATPSVIANAHTDDWCDKYLKDEFGRNLTDENGSWIVNPEFKEEDNENYVSRLDRPEWDAIGMLGVLCVRQDGTATVNGYVKVNGNGMATACDKNATNAYRVIDTKSENVAMIIFR